MTSPASNDLASGFASPNETYVRRQRHILLDMHVPDWHGRFLSRFDPSSFVGLCADAGADGVMVYCNSHVGLCYWPTKSGRVHRAFSRLDAVGAQVALLHERDIAVCAYYSGPIFNNWAYIEHPEWRIVPSSPGGMAGPGSRYGVVCPNHPDCLAFNLIQVGELVERYSFDAFFFDMVFWPSVCVCDSCKRRYRDEEDAEIPKAVDWYSESWCRFQAARERWLADAFRQLRDRVKAALEIPVFLNGGVVKFDWWAATGYELMALNDLVGGDFHHRSVLPTLSRFTPSVMQYMKAISAYGGGASNVMPVEEQKTHAFAAVTFGGQFMAIDAVAPDGSISPGVYAQLGEVFAAIKPFQSSLGHVPIADVGIYASWQAAVDFGDNGTPLDGLEHRFGSQASMSPHSAAVEGAVEALKEAHLPFGVLTRADLSRLLDFNVIVLPNVVRMDVEEIEAFRAYVRGGGRLYASGYTSLVTVAGTRHDEFLLGDVFGCQLSGEETAAVTYVKPAAADVASWIAPFTYVVHGASDVNDPRFGAPVTALRITVGAGADVLATTTLPYGDGRGSRDDQGWASVHNSPPWNDTGYPALVRHRYGAGEAIYSTADIEASGGRGSAARLMFTRIVRSLLDRPPAFDADAHPDVWITAFDNAEDQELLICFLHYPSPLPALPVPRIRFRVSPPSGLTFTYLYRVARGDAVPFSCDEDGNMTFELLDLQTFEMMAARYV